MSAHAGTAGRAGAVAASLVALALGLAPAGCAPRGAADAGARDGSSITTRVLAPDVRGTAASPAGGLAGLSWWRYPLAVGNRWEYRVRVRTQVLGEQGPEPPALAEFTRVEEITEHRRADEGDAFTQVETSTEQPDVRFVRYLRQDEGGLYLESFAVLPGSGDEVAAPTPWSRAIVAGLDRALGRSARRALFERAALALATRAQELSRPAPGAGAGPGPGEITLLRYPLRPGATWEIGRFPLPSATRSAERREFLRVPAGRFVAWRVHEAPNPLTSAFRMDGWYGSGGLLKSSFHAEVDVLDNMGNPIGRFILDEDQDLTGIRILAGF